MTSYNVEVGRGDANPSQLRLIVRPKETGDILEIPNYILRLSHYQERITQLQEEIPGFRPERTLACIIRPDADSALIRVQTEPMDPDKSL